MLGNQYENAKKRKDLRSDERYGSTKAYNNSANNAAIVGRVGLLITAIDLAQDTYNSVNGFFNFVQDAEQKEFILKSLDAVKTALDQGKISPQFQNRKDLSHIANFIFQGTKIENLELQKIAEDISKNIAKNYRYEYEPYRTASGMDNYPTQGEYREKVEFEKEEKRKN